MPHGAAQPPLTRRKPLIGVAGGIGSGKSTVARALAACAVSAGDPDRAVIDSDRIAHDVIQSPAVKDQLAAWWGRADTAQGGIFTSDGAVDRRAVARRIFNAPTERQHLESLIHPRVAEARAQRLAQLQQDPAVTAIVIDSPLLFETGLNAQCDATIFIHVPQNTRFARLQATRGWSENDLLSREKNQLPLEKKQQLADYVIDNGGTQAATLGQVRRVFSQIIEKAHA